MNTRPTKKAYEEYLNALHGVTHERWGDGSYGAQTRPYGTYLRNQDRDKFNVEYEEWAESQQGEE